MHVLGIPSTLRKGSYNRQLLNQIGERLAKAGVSFEIADVALPLYNEDDDHLEQGIGPAAVLEFIDKIRKADIVIVAAAEYNSSITGILKNALDWASRPVKGSALKGKPVGVVGTSTGLFGAVWSQDHTRQILKHIGADVLDIQLSVGQAKSAFEGEIEGLEEIINTVITTVQPGKNQLQGNRLNPVETSVLP